MLPPHSHGTFFSCRNLHSLLLESYPSVTCRGAGPLTCHRGGRGSWRFSRSRCTTCPAACPCQLLLPQLRPRVTPAAEQLSGPVSPRDCLPGPLPAPPAPAPCWLDTRGWQHPDDAGLSLARIHTLYQECAAPRPAQSTGVGSWGFRNISMHEEPLLAMVSEGFIFTTLLG